MTAFSVKYLALYSCWLTCFVLIRDFWRRLADRSIESVQESKLPRNTARPSWILKHIEH